MSREISRRSPERMPPQTPQREDFAPGKEGQISYEIIANGANCRTIIAELDGEKILCDMPASLVLNFDGYLDGETQYLPCCDGFHAIKAAAAISGELQEKDHRKSAFFINGGETLLFKRG